MPWSTLTLLARVYLGLCTHQSGSHTNKYRCRQSVGPVPHMCSFTFLLRFFHYSSFCSLAIGSLSLSLRPLSRRLDDFSPSSAGHFWHAAVYRKCFVSTRLHLLHRLCSRMNCALRSVIISSCVEGTISLFLSLSRSLSFSLRFAQ